MPADEQSQNPGQQAAPAEAEAPPPPPELPLHWSYLENGEPQDEGDAACTVQDKALHFKCQAGAPFDVPYSDIAAVEDKGVDLFLAMRDGSAYSLSKMARLRDMFRAALMEKWTKLNRKQALAEETLLESFEGRACHDGETPQQANIGVYETAVVLDFSSGDVQRIPLVFSGRPGERDYCFLFDLPGETWAVSHLGRETDRFRNAVSHAMNKLEEQAFVRVQALCPKIPPMKARKLAGSFLDGLAVRLSAARDAFSALADAMIKELGGAGLMESWEAVSALGDAANARIGQKAALRASEGLYRWFFVPVVRGDKAAIVMEASSEGSSGRATYVFRVPGGPSAVEASMDGLNYGLVMVNFRREPIYMSDEQMRKPENAHYLRSVERVPALAELRKNFIGRVAHTGQETWRKGLEEVLSKL